MKINSPYAGQFNWDFTSLAQIQNKLKTKEEGVSGCETIGFFKYYFLLIGNLIYFLFPLPLFFQSSGNSMESQEFYLAWLKYQ